MKFPLLVQPHHLAAVLGDPSVVVVDASVKRARAAESAPYTMTADRAAYDAGHIPGAVFADFLTDFSDPDGEFMFTVPDAARIERVATALGIGEGVHVVAYTQDLPYFAPRLWWLLRYYGFDDVSVLDGGLRGWRDVGLPVNDQPPDLPTVRQFIARPRPQLLARRADVERVALDGARGTCLVHSLSTSEFHGDGLPEDVRAGHIPGSINVPWYSVIDDRTGRYLAPAALGDLFRSAGVDPDQDVITYCGGGIAATMNAFALALTGRDDARVYDGSLAEWTADPALPLKRA